MNSDTISFLIQTSITLSVLESMPELPEVETVRRQLDAVVTGARITDVELRRPDLRIPFPPRFRGRLRGWTVTALTRRAKYLLAELSSGETLLMHLGMSGSFRIELARARLAGSGDRQPRGARATVDRHDHVVFEFDSGVRVLFNDPRRFGFMDLLSAAEREQHPVLSRLGPEPLSADFVGAALARACRGKRTSLKAALLDQRVVAGVGNIYASEALHVAGLSPRRRAGTLATPAGAPRDSAHRLAAAIKQVLNAAIARAAAGGRYRSSRFRVYDREGRPCRRVGCKGVIQRRIQAGRSTFYCPVCQR
jgi:formamidopyrimidine-DNA glycosylase